MRVRATVRGGMAATLLFVVVAASPGVSAATTATATVTGGVGLGMINGTPSTSASFGSIVLNGSDTAVSTPISFDVQDGSGSGAGWNITVGGTAFDDGAGHSIPAGAVTVGTNPSWSCDASSVCTSAGNPAVAYSWGMQAGGSSKLLNAGSGTGMGSMTAAPSFTLVIPGNTVAGVYSATWTFTLSSGP